MGRPKTPKPETRSEIGARLYDTSDPPLTLTQCARLAGIRKGTLCEYLRRREIADSHRCPHCHQVPRGIYEKTPYHNRSGKSG